MYKVQLVLPKDIKPLQEKMTDVITDIWIRKLGSKKNVDYLIEKLESEESEEFL